MQQLKPVDVVIAGGGFVGLRTSLKFEASLNNQVPRA